MDWAEEGPASIGIISTCFHWFSKEEGIVPAHGGSCPAVLHRQWNRKGVPRRGNHSTWNRPGLAWVASWRRDAGHGHVRRGSPGIVAQGRVRRTAGDRPAGPGRPEGNRPGLHGYCFREMLPCPGLRHLTRQEESHVAKGPRTGNRHQWPQKGFAAVETALALLVLAPLLLLLIEGAKVLGEYSTVLSASREAARMVLRENGDTSGAVDLAQALTEDLDGPTPEVEVVVTKSETENQVEVKVHYEYQPFLAGHSEGESVYEGLDMLSDWDGKLHASTTMPLP